MIGRHQIAVRHTIILALVFVVAFAATSSNQALREPRRNARFARDAAGRPAPRDAEWRVTLRSAGSMPIGLISAAGFCGQEAYLLDSRQSIVHRVDLATGLTVGQIGSSGGGPDEPSKPRGMALDCAGRRIYLISGTGVFAFDLTSGAVVRHILRPENFAYTGGVAHIDTMNDVLFVPGIWTEKLNELRTKGLDRMFERTRLGYKLSLRDGTATPLFNALEAGCWSFSSDCLNAVFDEVRGDGRRGWVVAQDVSTKVGVFDAEYRLQRVFDVRSPRFLENGRRASAADSPTDHIRWNEQNSVIRRVYAFGDRIVTVHTTNATSDWQPGQRIDFNVYMNIHSIDGAGLVSDIRLPDLPVARDERNLYVIDYGPGGRRINTQHVTLVRLPIVNQGE